MICRECGARIDDNASECKFCGAVYGETESVEPIPEPVAEESLTSEMAQEEIDAIIDENEIKRHAQIEKLSAEKQAQLAEIEKRRKDKKRRQRRNRFLIILLILLCGAAIAAGVYYISPSYTGESNDDVVLITQTPTVEPEKTELPEPTIGIVEDDETEAPTDTASPIITDAPVVTQTPVKTQTKATQKPTVTTKPVVNNNPTVAVKKNKITGALVTGGEVIKADEMTYMSFSYNGETCYAKVSDNTTTSFIANKPMTITAVESDAKYNGKAIYTITSITNYNGTYILQNSGTQFISNADLEGMTADKLRLARNEIYARHGRQFNDSTLQNYFNSCSWYKPNAKYNYANENKNLNSIEKKNVTTIMDYENSIK